MSETKGRPIGRPAQAPRGRVVLYPTAELEARLREVAARERRTITAQIEVLLERALDAEQAAAIVAA